MLCNRSKRRDIPVETKLEIVKRYKTGEYLYRPEKEKDFQKKQIKYWAKNEDSYISISKKQKRKRISGSGPKVKFEEVDKHLFVWFRDEREHKQQVNYTRLREKAKEIVEEFQIVNFVGSNKWIFNFCRRHHIGNRRITHQGQQNGRTAMEKHQVVSDFLVSSAQSMVGYKLMQIYNLDETTCYFDMASDQTLHFKGDKNVDGIDTRHRKSRFTVTLCCCADRRMVKTLIVFKRLKNVPKLNLPADVEVTLSMGGSINTCLMLKWIRSCFTQREPVLARTPSIPYKDSHGSHIKEEVSESLRYDCATKVLVIPPKMTSVLQPLDISLNSSFKAALRRGLLNWLINGPKEMTAIGYRR